MTNSWHPGPCCTPSRRWRGSGRRCPCAHRRRGEVLPVVGLPTDTLRLGARRAFLRVGAANRACCTLVNKSDCFLTGTLGTPCQRYTPPSSEGGDAHIGQRNVDVEIALGGAWHWSLPLTPVVPAPGTLMRRPATRYRCGTGRGNSRSPANVRPDFFTSVDGLPGHHIADPADAHRGSSASLLRLCSATRRSHGHPHRQAHLVCTSDLHEVILLGSVRRRGARKSGRARVDPDRGVSVERH